MKIVGIIVKVDNKVRGLILEIIPHMVKKTIPK